MWQAIVDGAMPGFWPPRPNWLWGAALEPLRRWYLHRVFGIADVQVEGVDRLSEGIGPRDGLLIAPNHSHDSDPHVMLEVSRRCRRRFYFMAAWQLFRAHRGLDGFVLQRLGAFSVDREGCDRRAVKQAIELLTTAQRLVVFPEGEVYYLNDRLTPLLEGVAFMALSAQRQLNELSADTTGSSTSRRVWIVPTAIRYRYVDDVAPQLEQAIAELEARLVWKPPHGASLPERIVRLGELALTIKEKEKLGASRDSAGDLPSRIGHLIETLLARHETQHLGRSPSAETVPLRVKALRRRLLEGWTDETLDAEARRPLREALDDVHLVLQLFSYPGDYVAQQPSLERMAETVAKFEEDILGTTRPKGKRVARVIFGQPIDLQAALATGRPRAIAGDVTSRLEMAIRDLMAARLEVARP